MKKERNEIMDTAFKKAKQYEMKSGGCSQCTLSGIFDAMGVQNDDIFKAATGLADGVGLTGNGHCGALSGGVLAIGYFFGRNKEDFSDMMKLIKANMLSKKLHDRFVKKYGTCRCADLQKSFFGRFYNLYDPEELTSAMKAGLLETCSTLVGEAARMTTEIILEAQEKDAK
ncbi:MAG: C_GCAxxG_C_C family protein [Desulfobacteraceae bacterium]|nr:MAG: C_GCAxxG_C_C family protein [Desulfobacteraceae bacterium]